MSSPWFIRTSGGDCLNVTERAYKRALFFFFLRIKGLWLCELQYCIMRPFVTGRIICEILVGKRTNFACMQVLENLCTLKITQLDQNLSSLRHPVVLNP